MNNMNPIFSLKNFRSFGNEGADFELAPITILTGCNSAGKSSLVKALMLLTKRPSLKGWNMAGERYSPSMYLKASSSDLRLGGYKNIVNVLSKDGTIELSYCMWSSFLHEEVVCKRFYREKGGALSDGVLSIFSIEKMDGTYIYNGTMNTYIDEEPFDAIVGDEHFDAIFSNYQRFVLAYRYDKYIRSLDESYFEGQKSEKIDLYSNITSQKEKVLEDLKELGLSVSDMEEYSIDAFRALNKILLADNESSLVRFQRERLTAEEKEKLQQQIFYNCVINEIVSPWFLQKLSFVDSSTNKISRIYNVEDTDKFSQILCKLVNYTRSSEYSTGLFVNKWLAKFGIGDKLIIVGSDEGMGVKIYLENNGVRRLLADEGYGITQLASLLLQMDILKNKYQYETFENGEVTNAYRSSFISIEEPEVHLHPKFQSMLADLFVEAYQNYNIHFIIETHSEYLIRKLQVLVADKENKLTANDVSLNYVEKDENGVSTNRKIEILEDGRLNGCFGKGFFDEAGELSRQLFNLSF